MTIIKMTDLDLAHKRVLIRVDFNVPIQNGEITSDARIKAALNTIEYARDAGAKVILISHLDRPKEGQYDPKYSLEPIAKALSALLMQDVRLEKDWLDGVELNDGEVVLCENVRFCEGEMRDDNTLAKKMAALADIFVMDAFGVAHRAQASTHGVARYAPIACAGLLMDAELEALSKALENPIRPLLAIVGGSKVSTKLGVLESILQKSDQLIVGGGIANTFLAANGIAIGKSLHEADLIPEATRLLALAEQQNTKIPLPTDVIVATELTQDAQATLKSIHEINDDEMILDIGPETAKQFADMITEAGTIVWNGPVGVFEYDKFSEGTKTLAMSIAQSQAFSIAGGGDTFAAIEKFNIADDISYISTGGGVFLEMLQGIKLPTVAILEERALLSNIKD